MIRLVKEPKGVDFVIESRPLSDAILAVQLNLSLPSNMSATSVKD